MQVFQHFSFQVTQPVLTAFPEGLFPFYFLTASLFVLAKVSPGERSYGLREVTVGPVGSSYLIQNISTLYIGNLPPALLLELAVPILIGAPHEGNTEKPLRPAWRKGWGSWLLWPTGSRREGWACFR